jgi:hypothetical protein
MAREKEADQEQHGGGQFFIRAEGNRFFYGTGPSTLQREDDDKLLMPYVPSGMKRISK